MPIPESSASPAFVLGDVTALVLAGGRGLRMGGVDKGLQPFRSQPMAQHALQRLATQQGGPLHSVLINANRNAEDYLALGEAAWGAGRVRVFADRVQNFSGPLAGFQAGLDLCTSPLLLTVPCDSPLFPLDLAQRLLDALNMARADIAVVQAPEAGRDGQLSLRSQPVFCLMKTGLLESLNDFLNQGGRKVDAWTAQHRVVQVPFNLVGDAPHAFANANTLDELRLLENT
ncbi:molybdenum cofactor guanylyltransferase MobA [Rhodoferax saidenbachensis]|uniref:Molybdenum cofactor guanylyltransferase n=1 Tax=Rhodoferax saidenbachensis TaxID=1484693 RepID=A0ABU1ZT67_9BURK|nr:molybdenum cofactor guanylyltransferase MobA [Rhodoferax saidenbachensis]MDR7308730.1 molybdopterin-guanine dinucleotide biosynthesis protein A [Rhodoferax saidenbachensis]